MKDSHSDSQRNNIKSDMVVLPLVYRKIISIPNIIRKNHPGHKKRKINWERGQNLFSQRILWIASSHLGASNIQ